MTAVPLTSAARCRLDRSNRSNNRSRHRRAPAAGGCALRRLDRLAVPRRRPTRSSLLPIAHRRRTPALRTHLRRHLMIAGRAAHGARRSTMTRLRLRLPSPTIPYSPRRRLPCYPFPLPADKSSNNMVPATGAPTMSASISAVSSSRRLALPASAGGVAEANQQAPETRPLRHQSAAPTQSKPTDEAQVTPAMLAEPETSVDALPQAAVAPDAASTTSQLQSAIPDRCRGQHGGSLVTNPHAGHDLAGAPHGTRHADA